MIQVIRTDKRITEEVIVFTLDEHGQFIYQGGLDNAPDVKETTYKVYDASIDGYRNLTPLEEGLIIHAGFEGTDFAFAKRPAKNYGEVNPF